MTDKKETKKAEVKTAEKPTASVEESTEVKVAPKRKGKEKKQISSGRVYVQATYNNTVITFTDATGNTIAQGSAGQAGFRGPKKSTPYAAGIIIKKIMEKVAPYGFKEASVFVKGVGGGREAAIRALNANGVNVLSIKDITPIPHNGPRPRKPRRV